MTLSSAEDHQERGVAQRDGERDGQTAGAGATASAHPSRPVARAGGQEDGRDAAGHIAIRGLLAAGPYRGVVGPGLLLPPGRGGHPGADGIEQLLRGRTGRGSLLRLGLLGFAACNLVHAGFYLAAGAFDVFGDGWLLHRTLGAWSHCFVGVAVLLTLLLSARLSREIAASCAWLGGSSRGLRLLLLSVAIAAAGGGHAALTAGEQVLRSPVPLAELLRGRPDAAASDEALARWSGEESMSPKRRCSRRPGPARRRAAVVAVLPQRP